MSRPKAKPSEGLTKPHFYPNKISLKFNVCKFLKKVVFMITSVKHLKKKIFSILSKH